MAETTLLVPRARDTQILDFFARLKTELAFNDYSYRLLASDDRMTSDHLATEHIRNRAGFAIQNAEAQFPNSVWVLCGWPPDCKGFGV
ncbi:MAG: hypothetical protein ACREVH_07590 [Gammaproteobacteria bacterium]